MLIPKHWPVNSNLGSLQMFGFLSLLVKYEFISALRNSEANVLSKHWIVDGLSPHEMVSIGMATFDITSRI